MEFGLKQKEVFKNYFLNLANLAEVKEGRLDFGGLWDGSKTLVDEIMKHPQIAGVIKSSEIFWLINNSFYRLHQTYKEMGDFRLSSKIPLAELDDAADKFLSLLAGLPYDHFFYFRLPIELPDKLLSIRLTDTISILRPSLAEKESFIVPPSTLADALLGNMPFKANDSDVFFKVKVSGYGDAAQASANTIFKQFLYLTAAAGLLTSKSWDRQDRRQFENSRYSVPQLEGEILQSFTLSSETAFYVSGIKLDQKRFSGFEPPDPKTATTILGGLLSLLIGAPIY